MTDSDTAHTAPTPPARPTHEPGSRHAQRAGRRWVGVHVGTPTLISLACSATLVLILNTSNPDFWHIDDAVNEFGPYVTEIGRLVTHGEWPVLTARSFTGGNELIDFNRSPLHPLMLTAALLLQHFDLHTTALIFATLLLTTAFLGAYALGRTLRMSWLSCYVLGFTYATSPLFLYMYASDWWNAAIGTVSFVWAVAALSHAARSNTATASILLGVATCILVLAGWPHGYLAYAAVCIVTAVVGLVGPRPLAGPGARLRWFTRLAVPVALGIIMGAPALLEYVVNAAVLGRANGFNNASNFAVPSVGQSLGVANPLGGDFWSIFGGYEYWDVPIGFVSLTIFVAVFFVKVDRRIATSVPVLASAALSAVLLLATQTPSQLGPTRWPFRFLPFAGLAIMVLTLYLIDKGRLVTSRTRLGLATATLITITLAAAWRVVSPARDLVHSMALPVALIVTVAGVFVALHRRRRLRSATAALAVLGTTFMLLNAPSAGANSRYILPADLPTTTELNTMSAASRGGMVFVTGAGAAFSNATAHGSRLLLAGTPIFNGYDPVLLARYEAHFTPYTAHGLVPEETLDYLTASRPDTWGQCGLVAAGITAVATASDPVVGRHDALHRCGFSTYASANGATVFSRRSSVVAGGPTVAIGAVDFQTVDVDDQYVRVHVTNRGTTPGTLIFSRLSWPGYSAAINGSQLPVGAVDGYLLTVQIPAGAEGDLELSYRPRSWPTAPIAAGVATLALLSYGAALAAAARRRKRNADLLE